MSKTSRQIILASLLARSSAELLTCGAAGGCRDHSLLQHSRASLKKPTELDFMTFPDTISFDTVVRDFKVDHPDFETMDGFAEGLVEPILGANRKPVFKGGDQLTNKSNFDQWYLDVEGVNKRFEFPMTFTRVGEGNYVHDDPFFFPVDGRGWMDSDMALDNQSHNFYFTLELHAKFVYTGDETFTFRGDDDVWVFINKQLVIDLGGVHWPMERTVALRDLNLTKRTAYDLDFFFAERRCCGSNFRIETSIKPVTSECIIWGDPHVSVFDHGLVPSSGAPAFNSIFKSGDYWLVKNSLVWIQARYGPTQWTIEGQAALLSLAVGGPFLRQGGMNHTLVITHSENHGNVTWSGEQIVHEVPSEFVIANFVRVTHKMGEHTIDRGLANYPVELVTVLMPRMVALTVNMWPDHIDAIITSPQQPEGQDGHCGNFNLNADDDTTEMILERTSMVTPEESLFPTAAATGDVSGIACMLESCPPAIKSAAQAKCEMALTEQEGEIEDDNRAEFVEACVFDVCCGGSTFAETDAVTESESEEVKSPEINSDDTGN